jgi:hypothetical protein
MSWQRNTFLAAHLEPSDGHFGCHVGAAFQQTLCDYGCGKIGVTVVAEGCRGEGVV